MSRALFLFIFLFQFTVGNAQNATVSGVCLPCSGSTVKLMVYDDLISFREIEVSEFTVDASGNFSLPFGFREVRYAWIKADVVRYDFFLSPGKDLKLEFDLVVPDQQETDYGLRGFVNLIPEFSDSPGTVLNLEIKKFNEELDRFLEAQYNLIAIRKAPAAVGKAVKEFKHRVDSTYAGKHPFLTDYIRYAVASVQLTSQRRKELMFADYLDEQRMLYHNIEFMRFFFQFHAEGLERQARYSKASEYKTAFDKREPDSNVQTLLMEDPYLQDVSHRQAVYVKGLGEITASELYDKKKVLGMLKRFSMYSSNSELAKGAKNLHWKHSRFMEGEKAPVFFANTVNGDLVSDRTFKEKYVVLAFSRAETIYSDRENSILPDLMQDYPDIRIISFIVNENKDRIVAYKEKQRLNWPVVKITRDSKIIEDFDLRSVPFYVILDKEWRFVKYGAAEPSRGLEKELFRIKDQLREKNKTKIGEK